MKNRLSFECSLVLGFVVGFDYNPDESCVTLLLGVVAIGIALIFPMDHIE